MAVSPYIFETLDSLRRVALYAPKRIVPPLSSLTALSIVLLPSTHSFK